MKKVIPTRSFVAAGIGSFTKGQEYTVTEAKYKIIQPFVRAVEEEPEVVEEYEVVEDIALDYDSD